MEVSSLELLFRVSLAAVAGAILGFERGLRGHPAGLRTHSLVCAGAALFTVVGMTDWGAGSAGVDRTRMAAQVVTGLGFIGAGAILRDGGVGVRGLTTAATIWVSGAVGVAFATGDYILAGGALAVILFVLIVLRVLRTAIGGIGSISMTLEIRYDVGHGTLGPVLGAIETSGVTIDVLKLNDTEHKLRADERDIYLTVTGRRDGLAEFEDLVQVLGDREEVRMFTLSRSAE